MSVGSDRLAIWMISILPVNAVDIATVFIGHPVCSSIEAGQ